MVGHVKCSNSASRGERIVLWIDLGERAQAGQLDLRVLPQGA